MACVQFSPWRPRDCGRDKGAATVCITSMFYLASEKCRFLKENVLRGSYTGYYVSLNVWIHDFSSQMWCLVDWTPAVCAPFVLSSPTSTDVIKHLLASEKKNKRRSPDDILIKITKSLNYGSYMAAIWKQNILKGTSGCINISAAETRRFWQRGGIICLQGDLLYSLAEFLSRCCEMLSPCRKRHRGLFYNTGTQRH